MAEKRLKPAEKNTLSSGTTANRSSSGDGKAKVRRSTTGTLDSMRSRSMCEKSRKKQPAKAQKVSVQKSEGKNEGNNNVAFTGQHDSPTSVRNPINARRLFSSADRAAVHGRKAVIDAAQQHQCRPPWKGRFSSKSELDKLKKTELKQKLEMMKEDVGKGESPPFTLTAANLREGIFRDTGKPTSDARRDKRQSVEEPSPGMNKSKGHKNRPLQLQEVSPVRPKQQQNASVTSDSKQHMEQLDKSTDGNKPTTNKMFQLLELFHESLSPPDPLKQSTPTTSPNRSTWKNAGSSSSSSTTTSCKEVSSVVDQLKSILHEGPGQIIMACLTGTRLPDTVEEAKTWSLLQPSSPDTNDAIISHGRRRGSPVESRPRLQEGTDRRSLLSCKLSGEKEAVEAEKATTTLGEYYRITQRNVKHIRPLRCRRSLSVSPLKYTPQTVEKPQSSCPQTKTADGGNAKIGPQLEEQERSTPEVATDKQSQGLEAQPPPKTENIFEENNYGRSGSSREWNNITHIRQPRRRLSASPLRNRPTTLMDDTVCPTSSMGDTVSSRDLVFKYASEWGLEIEGRIRSFEKEIENIKTRLKEQSKVEEETEEETEEDGQSDTESV